MALLRHVWLALVLLSALPAGAAVRVKDLVETQGVRQNELFGYGLVVGLAGSGDTEQVLFTAQSLSGMLGRMGIRIDPKDMRFRNVAAVMVTARLPTYARAGTHLDVEVGAMGNARSLEGGLLLITPLTAADGSVYAVAQGALQVGGYQVSGAGSSIRRNQPNSGRIPGGATVEKAVTPALTPGPLVLQLKSPDFTTATRIAAVINGAVGPKSAKATDPAAVEVTPPADADLVALLSKVEQLEVDADQRARIAVSERTGTIVAGARVQIRPVVVAHGGMQVSVSERPFVSQPNPFSQGQTVTTRTAQLSVNEPTAAAVALPAVTTVDELVKALNLLGANTRDLIAVLQAMKAAGAIDADIEVL